MTTAAVTHIIRYKLCIVSPPWAAADRPSSCQPRVSFRIAMIAFRNAPYVSSSGPLLRAQTPVHLGSIQGGNVTADSKRTSLTNLSGVPGIALAPILGPVSSADSLTEPFERY